MPAPAEQCPCRRPAGPPGVRAANVVTAADVVQSGSRYLSNLTWAMLRTQVLGGVHVVDARCRAVPLNASLEVELVEEPGRSKLAGASAGSCQAL